MARTRVMARREAKETRSRKFIAGYCNGFLRSREIWMRQSAGIARRSGVSVPMRSYCRRDHGAFVEVAEPRTGTIGRHGAFTEKREVLDLVPYANDRTEDSWEAQA